MAKKLNHSNPLRGPDGLAFPLPSESKPSLPVPCYRILLSEILLSEGDEALTPE